MTLQATLNSLVFEQTRVRYEPPADFYNPNLTIATHKTAPKLHEQVAVKTKDLQTLLTSKKTDPRNDKNAAFLNNLEAYEKTVVQ